MSALLNGLKEYTDRITAVVTVTDNGGSSGRLRNDFEMAPPGDIRNCLLALADIDPLVAQAFQYRFGEAEFKDHCFGNLFITVLTRLVGDFGASIRELNRLLNVRGRVIPATSTRVSLVARHPDGSKSTGEVEIARSGKAIEKVEIRPAPVVMSAEIRQAVEEADLFLFGPGSLYTSVIPNLLLEGIVEAINATGKERVYVANIMTQPGETDGYALSDHIRALRDHVGAEFPDAVVAHQGAIPEEMLCRYRATGAEPVRCDLRDHREFDSVRLISSDFFSEGDTVCEDAALQGEGSPGAALTGTVLHGKVPRGTATRGPVPCRPVARGTVRHDPAELARVLYREFLAPFELQDRAASQEGTEAPGRSVGITVEAHETRALG
jgi:uncharacterized cofD-like protein